MYSCLMCPIVQCGFPWHPDAIRAAPSALGSVQLAAAIFFPSVARLTFHYMRVTSTILLNPFVQLAAMPNGNKVGQCDKCKKDEVIIHGGGDPRVVWLCESCCNDLCSQKMGKPYS